MIERRPIKSLNELNFLYPNGEIEKMLTDRGLSVCIQISPRIPVNTDNTGVCYPDWSLQYWTKPKSLYEVLGYCLSFEDINKLLKTIRFSSVEKLIEDAIEKIRESFGIKCMKSKIIEDPEDQEEMLLVEVFVDESDPKQVIELWKEISTRIRDEIDKEFGNKSKEFQLKLWISVKPS